ncbi:MAG: hypothetical protein HZC28_17330 [Spirochaetes bacterium]|nr:hypothetical protein [Spirochaetota bacterium]
MRKNNGKSSEKNGISIVSGFDIIRDAITAGDTVQKWIVYSFFVAYHYRHFISNEK